jgi:hypothetical protein
MFTAVEYKILVFCDVIKFTFIVTNFSEEPASSFPKAENGNSRFLQ